MPNRPTSCAYCGGALPPPALTGRPRTFCSAQCRQANERVVVSGNREEKERREQERLEAEAARRRAKHDAERARRHEREYREAIEAGGTVAQEARWEELWSKTLEEGRWSLCQWPQPDDRPGGCMRRTANVYCGVHNGQLDREAARHRRNDRQLPDPSRTSQKAKGKGK